jgi:hypothetical protein
MGRRATAGRRECLLRRTGSRLWWGPADDRRRLRRRKRWLWHPSVGRDGCVRSHWREDGVRAAAGERKELVCGAEEWAPTFAPCPGES